jgi:hypothetical protein
VDGNVGQMMPAWIQAIKLDVSHMRQPGEGMPVAGIDGTESPNNILAGYAPHDVRVFRDIDIIVEPNELMASYRQIYGQGCDKQRHAKQNREPLIADLAKRHLFWNNIQWLFLTLQQRRT